MTSLAGALSLLVSVDDVSLRLFFCVFNLIWVTVFIEAWKRESASLAYTWGTHGQDKFEECRAAFYGELRKSACTSFNAHKV